jgi:nitrite reductase/ring-hydroxylating ferredoxin subunit
VPDSVQVARLDQLAVGTGTLVTVAGDAIALFSVDGSVYAIDPWCIRCASCLGGGILQGSIVSCPDCDWQYDVTCGCLVGVPALRLETFMVTLVGDQIMVSTR